MAVSIQQAAMNSLAVWLQTALGLDVVVSQRWPAAQKPLPPKACTLLMVGTRDEEFLPPEVVSFQTLPGVQGSQGSQGFQGSQGAQSHALYRWKVAEIIQPFQVDIWANYDVVRDDLVKRLQDAIHVGTLPYQPVANSPTLQLSDGWVGAVDFIVDQGTNNDLPNAAEVCEWRATYSGEARVVLYVDAISPKQAQIILKQTLSGATRTDDIAD